MKNISILFTIATLLLLFSCKKEEVAPFTISDFKVQVGNDETNGVYNIPIDRSITFMDLTQNVSTHEWRIEDGSFYLSETFSPRDTALEGFILPDAGKVSTDVRINVLFTEPGLQPVRIINTFDQEPAASPSEAIEQNGVWTIDTSFMVDVYADILPAIKVFKDGEEILSVDEENFPDREDQDSWPVVEVEAGESLTFVDVTTTGRPNDRTWRVAGAVPETSTDSSFTVSFFTIGTFAGARLTSRRGETRPGQTVQKNVPIRVEVVPSSQPLLFVGNLMEQENETISFNVGGELEPFSGQEGAFTVQVTNEAAGYDQTIPVQTARVSTDDATVIELILSEPIYNSDVITVSYDGEEIKSADFRTLAGFGPETVSAFFGANLLGADWAGYETFDANWKKAFCNGFWAGNPNGSEAMPFFARTEELQASGLASMKLIMYNGVEDKFLQGGMFSSFGLPAGDYVVSYKVYLEPGNILTTLQTFVQTPFTNIIWDIENIPRGEWVELSQAVSFMEAPTGRYDFEIKAANNPASTEQQILYLDDQKWVPSEPRL